MKKLVGFFVIGFLLTVTITGLLLGGVKINKVQAQVQTSDFVCPERDIQLTSCLGPKDCLYPDPASCNSFIQCTVNADNITGNPTVKSCPAGLEWNDNEKICDWSDSSTCPR